MSRPKISNDLFVTLLGAAAAFCVGVFDYITGPQLSSLIFLYLIPISFSAWFATSTAGAVVAVLSVIFSLAASLLGAEATRPYAFGNALFQILFFGLTSYAVASIKDNFEKQRRRSLTDPLTRLWNEKGFLEMAAKEISRAQRYGRPFTFVYLDVDDFAIVNARLERVAGDNLLQIVSKAICDNVRSLDVVGRIGEDAFGILMPETPRENGVIAIRRIRTEIARQLQLHRWAVTFSLGSITFLTPPKDVREMMQRVGTMSGKIKQAGKNVTLDDTAQ